MNKSLIIVLVLILASAGAFILADQNQKAVELEQMQIIEAQRARENAFAVEAKKVAAQKALEEARRIEAEAQKAEQLVLEEAKRLEEAALQKAADLQAKISGLIATAKSLLESGNYQEAIDMAKDILSQDADNPEATSILETAMVKLEEFTQQQAASLITEDPQ